MYEREVLELFNCMVVDSHPNSSITTCPEYGYVVNFTPTAVQEATLKTYFKPLDVRTLFSVEERKTLHPEVLMRTQLLDYIATYGLHELFNHYRKMTGTALIEDAAFTVFTEPTVTCLGIGPIYESDRCDILKSLRPLI